MAWKLLGTRYRTPQQTADLIEHLNTTWAFSQQVASDSKLLHRKSNPALYRLYLLKR